MPPFTRRAAAAKSRQTPTAHNHRHRHHHDPDANPTSAVTVAPITARAAHRSMPRYAYNSNSSSSASPSSASYIAEEPDMDQDMDEQQHEEEDEQEQEEEEEEEEQEEEDEQEHNNGHEQQQSPSLRSPPSRTVMRLLVFISCFLVLIFGLLLYLALNQALKPSHPDRCEAGPDLPPPHHAHPIPSAWLQRNVRFALVDANQEGAHTYRRNCSIGKELAVRAVALGNAQTASLWATELAAGCDSLPSNVLDPLQASINELSSYLEYTPPTSLKLAPFKARHRGQSLPPPWSRLKGDGHSKYSDVGSLRHKSVLLLNYHITKRLGHLRSLVPVVQSATQYDAQMHAMSARILANRLQERRKALVPRRDQDSLAATALLFDLFRQSLLYTQSPIAHPWHQCCAQMLSRSSGPGTMLDGATESSNTLMQGIHQLFPPPAANAHAHAHAHTHYASRADNAGHNSLPASILVPFNAQALVPEASRLFLTRASADSQARLDHYFHPSQYRGHRQNEQLRRDPFLEEPDILDTQLDRELDEMAMARHLAELILGVDELLEWLVRVGLVSGEVLEEAIKEAINKAAAAANGRCITRRHEWSAPWGRGQGKSHEQQQRESLPEASVRDVIAIARMRYTDLQAFFDQSILLVVQKLIACRLAQQLEDWIGLYEASEGSIPECRVSWRRGQDVGGTSSSRGTDGDRDNKWVVLEVDAAGRMGNCTVQDDLDGDDGVIELLRRAAEGWEADIKRFEQSTTPTTMTQGGEAGSEGAQGYFTAWRDTVSQYWA